MHIHVYYIHHFCIYWQFSPCFSYIRQDPVVKLQGAWPILNIVCLCSLDAIWSCMILKHHCVSSPWGRLSHGLVTASSRLHNSKSWGGEPPIWNSVAKGEGDEHGTTSSLFSSGWWSLKYFKGRFYLFTSALCVMSCCASSRLWPRRISSESTAVWSAWRCPQT